MPDADPNTEMIRTLQKILYTIYLHVISKSFKKYKTPLKIGTPGFITRQEHISEDQSLFSEISMDRINRASGQNYLDFLDDNGNDLD